MTVPGSRITELLAAGQEAQPWDVGADDAIGLALDVEDTSGLGSAGTGSVKPIRNRNLRAMTAKRRFPAISLSPPLPVRLNNGWQNNTVAFGYNHMWVATHPHGVFGLPRWYIYVAAIDYQNHPHLFRRAIPNVGTTDPTASSDAGTWAHVDLSTILVRVPLGNEHESQGCFVADGYAHYMMSPRGGTISDAYGWCTVKDPTDAQLTNLSNWTTGNLGDASAIISYPAVTRRSDGKLLLHHRHSISGNAYDGYSKTRVFTPSGSAPANGDWAAGVTVIDGHNDAAGVRGPYFWNPIVDPNDASRVGYFFCWRKQSDGNNIGLGYIESLDDGVTWQKIDGTAITLPFTSAQFTGAAVVKSIDTTVSLFINQGGATFDSRSRPHCVHFAPASGSKIMEQHYWDGSTWAVQQFAPDNTPAYRPTIVRDNQGGVYIIFRGSGRWQRSLWLVDVTPGRLGHTSPVPLINFDMGVAEVPHSEIAQTDLGLITLLVTTTNAYADNDSGGGVAVVPYGDYMQGAYVLTLDCDRLYDIAQGYANPPAMQVIKTVPIPKSGSKLLVAGSLATPHESLASAIHVNGDIASEQLFMRIAGRALVASGEMQVKITETPYGGSATVSADHRVTNTTIASHRTPWMPCQVLKDGTTGVISFQVGMLSGAGGEIDGTLELAALRPTE